MRYAGLRFLTFSVLLISTLSGSFAVGFVLYRSALDVNKQDLQHLVDTTVRVIHAVSQFDNIFSKDDFQGDAAAATLSQVEVALSGEVGFGRTGEILLLRMEDDAVRVLVHQTTNTEGEDHPERVMPGSPYYDALKSAFNSPPGYQEVDSLHGDPLVIAHAAIPDTEWALIAERHVAEITAPFYHAGLIGGSIALLAALVGGLINMRAAFRVSAAAREAETKAADALASQIEAQQRLEHAMQSVFEAEDRVNTAFEHVPIGIVIADQSGEIIRVNQRTDEMFGYEPGELVGMNVSELAAGDHRAQHHTYMKNYQDTGHAKVIGVGGGREVTGVRTNGEEFPARLGIAEIFMDGDVHYIASIQDLSEAKALEDKLRQSTKMEAVGQLVGGVSHDFNNLLAIISGNLELAIAKTDPETSLGKRLEDAYEAAERGSNLTRKLLGFSRQLPREAMSLDVNEVYRNLHDLLQRALTDKVVIRLTLADDLPEANADESDLQDAITNLCINARDAMPGGGEITIETRLSDLNVGDLAQELEIQPGLYVETQVRDTGTGMPDKVANRIFDPFFSTKEKGKGTGLGLSMVYGFAKRSGGHISVASKLGVGTTFTLLLPVATEEEVISEEEENDEDTDIDVTGTETILIVDDEESLVRIVDSVLTDLGYNTIVAHSGEEALGIVTEGTPIDLLLSDIIMPGGMDGIELAKWAKQQRPDLKVCLISGFTGASGIEQTEREVPYPLLRKPVTNAKLARTLRSLLDETAGV